MMENCNSSLTSIFFLPWLGNGEMYDQQLNKQILKIPYLKQKKKN